MYQYPFLFPSFCILCKVGNYENCSKPAGCEINKEFREDCVPIAHAFTLHQFSVLPATNCQTNELLFSEWIKKTRDIIGVFGGRLIGKSSIKQAIVEALLLLPPDILEYISRTPLRVPKYKDCC